MRASKEWVPNLGGTIELNPRLLVDYFSFRIHSEIEETLRRFCRDKDLQKSSSRRSQVSDSQKTSEKSLEVSPWEFRESFRRFETFKNLAQRGFSLKSRKAPGPPL